MAQAHLIREDDGRVLATGTREDCEQAQYELALSRIRTRVIDAFWTDDSK